MRGWVYQINFKRRKKIAIAKLRDIERGENLTFLDIRQMLIGMVQRNIMIMDYKKEIHDVTVPI